MAQYDNKLFKQAAAGPLTAEQIGEIMGRFGADALTRLRSRKDVRVMIVGYLPRENGRPGPPKKLYKIEYVDKAMRISGPYCCGYCEHQRQLDATP